MIPSQLAYLGKVKGHQPHVEVLSLSGEDYYGILVCDVTFTAADVTPEPLKVSLSPSIIGGSGEGTSDCYLRDQTVPPAPPIPMDVILSHLYSLRICWRTQWVEDQLWKITHDGETIQRCSCTGGTHTPVSDPLPCSWK